MVSSDPLVSAHGRRAEAVASNLFSLKWLLRRSRQGGHASSLRSQQLLWWSRLDPFPRRHKKKRRTAARPPQESATEKGSRRRAPTLRFSVGSEQAVTIRQNQSAALVRHSQTETYGRGVTRLFPCWTAILSSPRGTQIGPVD